jgi:uncharacterized protein
MIFVDTSAWFAAAVPWDAKHAAATEWLTSCRDPLVTSDYVVDETLTLLRTKGENERAMSLGSQFFDRTVCTVVRLTDEDIRAAWDIFHRFADKEWSFTDCASRVVMDRLQVSAAFAFDQHFRQFGTVTVVP